MAIRAVPTVLGEPIQHCFRCWTATSCESWRAASPGMARRSRHRPNGDPIATDASSTRSAGPSTHRCDGRITFFNAAAAESWGRRPALGEEWCGSLRLLWLDGGAEVGFAPPVARDPDEPA